MSLRLADSGFARDGQREAAPRSLTRAYASSQRRPLGLPADGLRLPERCREGRTSDARARQLPRAAHATSRG